MHVQTGKLVFKSYKPLKLEKGMYFLVRKNDNMVITMLEHVPFDEDDYIQMNGYPVELYIIYPGNPNIANDGYVIAQPHQIGWWDEGEHTDELRDITVKEINNIIEFYDGNVDIEVEPDYDENGYPVPMFAEGQVIMSYSEDEDVDDQFDYFFDDDESYTPPSSNDEWENNFINQNVHYDKNEE